MIPGPKLDEARAVVSEAAQQAGRDPASLGMEGRATWGAGGVDDVAKHADRWIEAGATHLAINTMGAGLVGLDAHLDALARAAEAMPMAQSGS